MEELTIDLFEPGMSPLHRAGLGGLAATVRWLNDERTPADRRPPGTLSYDDRSVTLSWESPADAGPFLQKLYESAFDLENGLIHLPGSYDSGNPPEPPVKAALQSGMLQTILQHNKARKVEETRRIGSYDADDGTTIIYEYKYFEWYKHRSAWEDLVRPNSKSKSSGTLKAEVKVKGTIGPGFAVRHQAFETDTIIRQTPGHAIALHFALIGTFALPIGDKAGVLIVPTVEDLEAFAERRASLNPREPKSCKISSPADTALQAMVRISRSSVQATLDVPGCLAVLFTSQDWYKKQNTRAAVIEVDPDEKALERFAIAMAELKPRVARSSKPAKKGGTIGAFWADSVVRPFIAENLARGRLWFEDFRKLVVGCGDGANKTWNRVLKHEKEGLIAMIEQNWQDERQKKLVEAVHASMNQRFGKIWKDADGNDVAYRNRLDRQMQRWRLAFAGAKTPDDIRNALTDMWSRSIPNAVLKAAWADVLPLLCDDRQWKLNRDLALLALASYSKPKAEEQSGGNEPDVDDE